jgi:DNA-binding NarL/FixJ family response regulator
VICDDLRVPVTVLIVDDHAGFRAAARELLELDGFVVVGEAGDGAAALECARELEPDVVLLDVGLPGASGFEVAGRLAGASAAVVLISSREQRDLGRRVRRCGARGFIAKERLSGEALHALLGAAG